MAIDVNALLLAGRCYGCLDPLIRRRVYAGLLCLTVRVDDPTATCNTPIDGCISCLSVHQLQFLQTQLLCTLAQIGDPTFVCDPPTVEPCLSCLDPAVQQTVITTLASQALTALDPTANTAPTAVLAAVSCLSCLSDQPLEARIAQLLVDLVTQVQPVSVPELLGRSDGRVTNAGLLAVQSAWWNQIVSVPPGPPTPTDPEVDDWADVRVPANGGTVSVATKAAVTVFMLAIKAAGIRTKIRRLNTYAGDQLAAAAVALIRDDLATGTPTGTSADVMANYVGGDYVENAGLTGNGNPGSDKSARTPQAFGLIPSANDVHYASWSNTASAGLTQFGVINTLDKQCITNLSNGGNVNAVLGDTTNPNFYATYADASNGKGLYLANRPSSAAVKGYRNGVLRATSVSTAGTLPTTLNYNATALNNNAVTQSANTRTWLGYSIGLGLTDADVTALYNAWATLQTSLGRVV